MRLKKDVYFYPGQNGMDFSGEINCNTILVTGRRHLLIDPGIGGRWEDLKASVKADGLSLEDVGLVFLTHSHPDHAEASLKCKEELGAQVALGFREMEFVGGVGRIFYRREFYEREPSGARYKVSEYMLPDKSMLAPVFPGPFRFEDREFRLYDTPGHSPGGLSLHWPEAGLLVVGDNYFPGTIGAFDLPGGSFPTMERSLKILRGLGEVDLVLCGHGSPIEGAEPIMANYSALFDEVQEKKLKMAANGRKGGGK